MKQIDNVVGNLPFGYYLKMPLSGCFLSIRIFN